MSLLPRQHTPPIPHPRTMASLAVTIRLGRKLARALSGSSLKVFLCSFFFIVQSCSWLLRPFFPRSSARPQQQRRRLAPHCLEQRCCNAPFPNFSIGYTTDTVYKV
ncbi:hypothetical protein GALMADRAFT_1287946 [Galerina marginata CBS 339.88]|uniref:Uncharacterized protein n=1 Tax=Galerina marginata (strain CBS 339.88) TaxID=685588 RepID=A0A067T7D7_GALM3|nr:hypothetical protein GALMADRAFT_1287946 [Galerina marginata CBS 339.88]